MDPEEDLEDDLSLDDEIDEAETEGDQPDEPNEDEVDEDDLTGLDDEADEPAPRQPSRGEQRVARATREAREAKERSDRLEREMAELRASLRPQSQTQQETPQQRQERLAAMDPYDRLQYELQESRRETAQVLQRIEFESRDNADKVAYDGLCQRAPIAAKLKNEVEKRLADMRAAGTTAPRETVLRWVIGDRALANASKATTRARKTADRNVERQTARPVSGSRGDAPAEGRKQNSSSARDKRVESYQL